MRDERGEKLKNLTEEVKAFYLEGGDLGSTLFAKDANPEAMLSRFFNTDTPAGLDRGIKRVKEYRVRTVWSGIK